MAVETALDPMGVVSMRHPFVIALHLLINALPLAEASQGTLRVLAVTPSTSSAAVNAASEAAPPVLSGREAITVTFDHAIIALGSDFGPGEIPAGLTPFALVPAVAGRLRWVTTSVARFDPESDWPAELELTLRLSPALQAFDGRRITPSAQSEWAFTTPSISMSLGRVRSAMALAMANGTWDASVHPLVPNAKECPPDATIELRFDADIHLSLLQAALRLRRNAAAVTTSANDAPLLVSNRVSIAPCRMASPRCALATLDATLDVGALYDIVLPAGSRFHAAAGLTHTRQAVTISGLVPFRFPFRNAGMLRAKYRRYKLWARHGLAPGTSAADLLPYVSLMQGGAAVPFTLTRRAAAVLELHASFEPSVQYTLSISASDAVRDGFGLPLRASSLTYTTSSLDSFFLLPNFQYGAPQELRLSTHNATASPAVADALRSWPTMLRGDNLCVGYQSSTRVPECWRHGNEPQSASMYAVSADDVSAAIATLRNQGSHSNDNAMWRQPAHVATVDSANVPRRGVTTKTFALGNRLLHAPGMLVQTTRGVSSGSSVRSALLSAGMLAAVAVAVPGSALLVWVLNATTAAPVANARINVMAANCWGRCTAGNVRNVATTTSESNGLGSFSMSLLPQSLGELYVLVEGPAGPTSRELLLLHGVPRPRSLPRREPVATLLTDRSVYKLNDTVRVKGYCASVAIELST